MSDVIIIGLGACGGIAAHVLTEAGLEVLGLEAGPRLGSSDASFDEIGNGVQARLSEPKAKHEVPTWRFSASEESGPSPWPMLMMNAVGGTTLHYQGLAIRLSPWTFRSRSATLERYGPSAIPPGACLADWPLSYDDLEPYYDAVEYAIGVAGAAAPDNGGDSRGNVFEGQRARKYPMPPLRSTGWSDLMTQAGRTLGWHPFVAPSNINSEPYDGRPACTYCGFCMHNACYCDAKGAVHLNVIRRAESTGLLSVEARARVVRIEVDRDGLARGVTYVVAGEERFATARVVLLAAYTYENARLLLLSRSRAYPDGLSNNASQVGKYFTAHLVSEVYGRFPDRRLNLFTGTGSQVAAVDDWNSDNFDHSGVGFIGGGLFLAAQEYAPIAFAKGPVPGHVPRWGGAWKQWIAQNAQAVGSANSQFDALPYESTFLDLDPVKTDPYGLPVVRVTHRVEDNEKTGAAFLGDRLGDWLKAAGAAETWNLSPRVEGRHCYGGARMGYDPDSSVVDAHGFSHEVPNLGVLGASVFPTAGGYNPTLTAQALSWRTAERLVRGWSSIGSLTAA